MSWAAVLAWSFVVWLTVPVAPAGRDWVEARWGREAFTVGSIAVALAIGIACLVYLYRRRLGAAGYLWIIAVTSVFAGFAWWLRPIPEEAVHLIEYAVLGGLAYRALVHHVRDQTIFVTAALVGAVVGVLDEGLQWVAPNRYWTLSDIWINWAASGLAQLGIAKGLRPRIIESRISAAGVRYLCRAGVVFVVVLAANLLNTPQRIGWYATRVPGLEFLLTNESVMFEYGYLYDDPEAGIFRSRLSPSELARTDRERGREVARILDAYPNDLYDEFLNTYTPVNDPFTHEARVHIFSRDRRAEQAHDPSVSPLDHATAAARAYRENRILERFFPETLRHSSYVLAPEEIAYLDANRWPEERLRAKDGHSWVSRHLVTDFTESQIMTALAVIVVGLLAIDRLVGARARGVAR